MATLKFWVCLLLILFSFPSYETRSFALFPKDEHRTLIDSGKEIIEESLQREDINREIYDTNRLSPGGPDPYHH